MNSLSFLLHIKDVLMIRQTRYLMHFVSPDFMRITWHGIARDSRKFPWDGIEQGWAINLARGPL